MDDKVLVVEIKRWAYGSSLSGDSWIAVNYCKELLRILEASVSKGVMGKIRDRLAEIVLWIFNSGAMFIAGLLYAMSIV